MKDEKKKRFIQIFALAVIMLLIASASYAYFATQVGDASSTNIIVNTSTVDSLTFETGEAISISATQSNFGSGAGNQGDSTYASATLVANNDTSSASANYYLYIKIDTNEFEYTTSDKTAELILSITDPDSYEVTSLSGLTYTSVTDGNGDTISGFDITTKTGLITIAEDYLIESIGSNTQEWNIKVTLVNLDSDQSGNADKSFSASLVIQNRTYGNTLQAYVYDTKIWAYNTNITKIIIDDTGIEVTDYYEMFDISETAVDPGCYYQGNDVYSYGRRDTAHVTEYTCSGVYKVTDDDYEIYFDNDFLDTGTYFVEEAGEAIWDSGSSTCTASNGSETVTWYYWNSPTEEQCTGTVYYDGNEGVYFVGIEYVGSGEWHDLTISDSSILAYIVKNNTTTTSYTMYIVSDTKILANEDMSYWFSNFTSVTSIEGLDKIITSNTTNMSGMFYKCNTLDAEELSDWDTSNVTDMSYMFSNCGGIKSSSKIVFDTSNVTDMSYMFSNCTNILQSFDLNSFDTANVIYMTGMFSGCSKMQELYLDSWDTSNVTHMSSMFKGCVRLSSLDLSSFDTSNVTDMSMMFSATESYVAMSLTYLDFSNADFSNVKSYYSMFWNTGSVKIVVKDISSYDFISTAIKDNYDSTAGFTITIKTV